MPRPKAPGAAEPKKRSRNGCWPCKARKVKCGEERPKCQNCVKQGEECDYSIRLNWGGRSKRQQDGPMFNVMTPTAPPAKKLARQTGSDGQTTFQGQIHDVNATRNGRQSSLTATGQDGALHQSSISAGAQWETSHIPDSTLETAHSQAPSFNQLPSFAQLESAVVSDPSAEEYGRQWQGASDHDSNVALNSYADTGLQLPPLSRSSSSWTTQHNSKRRKLDSPAQPSMTSTGTFAKPMLPESVTSPNASLEQPSPYQNFTNAFNAPITPGSSVHSETSGKHIARSNSFVAHDYNDIRRLSVNSLLSGPPGEDMGSNLGNHSVSTYPRVVEDNYVVYGYDYGHPDLDIPRNDDRNAIVPNSPTGNRSGRPTVNRSGSWLASSPDQHMPPPALERGGYYADPVLIKIHADFEPLPQYLTETPMNLLYFHHFLNHTARVLVPFDCPDNPLKTLVPQMACRNANLMNLLLAYSASHRARLLNQPEPANRIALWVRDVFPDLRTALSSSGTIPNESLATAVMLASLEIISPNTFGVPIAWQNHLHIARSIITSRGGLSSSGQVNDTYFSFLCKWFNYLDVVGSLSGGNKAEVPLSGESWSQDDETESKNGGIDCFLGTTTRCISLLARVARMSAECDSKRIDNHGDARIDWTGPGPAIEQEVHLLKIALEKSRVTEQRYCIHHHSVEPMEDSCSNDIRELFAANEMFHWAGVIHLNRRVLGKPRTDPEVQAAVHNIVDTLAKIQDGSSTGGGIIFPMFTAGCDALDQQDRDFIMSRLKGVEGWGMTNVQEATQLMQEVWRTGRPWETLVAGEFFG